MRTLDSKQLNEVIGGIIKPCDFYGELFTKTGGQLESQDLLKLILKPGKSKALKFNFNR